MSNAKPHVTAPEPDRVLFKYMRKAHAQRLLSEGVVRIGTLYEYRNIEKHGLVVGDDAEGTKSAVMHVPDLTMTKQEHVPEFVRQRWSRLSEHRTGFDKWSPAGLTSVQSCPRRRAGVACDERTTDAVGNSCSPLMLPV
jgi:hypothetical protein